MTHKNTLPSSPLSTPFTMFSSSTFHFCQSRLSSSSLSSCPSMFFLCFVPLFPPSPFRLSQSLTLCFPFSSFLPFSPSHRPFLSARHLLFETLTIHKNGLPSRPLSTLFHSPFSPFLPFLLSITFSTYTISPSFPSSFRFFLIH